MKVTYIISRLLLSMALILGSTHLSIAAQQDCDTTNTTYLTGIMIEEISIALDNPDLSSSLITIMKYGTDSRYYVMIRGWLTQELNGVQSQLDAIGEKQQDSEHKQKFTEKVYFLKQAIRRIDLE
ncbi:hypothetical protein HQQ94_21940 [Shewanella sp. VB17]|uniref:hypothetical protein n=1 Tax=Shewanella sp. VB17 TaxID=2739432 RepID=UPI001565BD8A|nr:hypothetical protein [Shewanella sp. VB17]NRD75829.1 hypothetical protein [Shewanella sp. VB17]